MKTIGEVLKSRRERLGMTLSELEQRTQLKRQTLIHIENNDFNELAKSDYTEGFIRKYAKVVNIEPNQLIEAHQDEIPETQYQIVDVDGFHYFNIFNRLDTRSINYINICFRNEDLI